MPPVVATGSVLFQEPSATTPDRELMTQNRATDASQFTAMVSGPTGANNFAVAPAALGSTPVAAAVTHQADLFKQVIDVVQRTKAGSSTMSVTEMTAASMDIMLRMSMAQMNFTASTSVVQSVKSSVQTLMKNQ
jgi:hypothetical protein